MVELWRRFGFDALEIYKEVQLEMRQTYSTVKENGYEYALQVTEDLRAEGYEIISGPEEGMIPRGEDSNGRPIMVEGYRIVVDDGRPSHVTIIPEE